MLENAELVSHLDIPSSAKLKNILSFDLSLA